MKIKIKQTALPEVHILGDLHDAGNFVKAINKKNTLPIFKDGEQGTCYIPLKGNLQPVAEDEILILDKDYKLVHLSFFPSQKKVEPLILDASDSHEAEQEPPIQEPPIKIEKAKKESKKPKAVKKVKKVKKEKKTKNTKNTKKKGKK